MDTGHGEESRKSRLILRRSNECLVCARYLFAQNGLDVSEVLGCGGKIGLCSVLSTDPLSFLLGLGPG